MALFLVIVVCGSSLIAYALFEKRINRATCPGCGSRISIDASDVSCPRCDSSVQKRPGSDANSQIPRKWGLLSNWPRVVFVAVPLSILIVSGSLLLAERLQSDTEKAIRLVKESNSRKENFSVQQYLYATVYHRRELGEPITITGWRVSGTEEESPVTVDFVYNDSDGEHVATWEADVRRGRVSPKNDSAQALSWR